MIEILLATHNVGKVREIRQLAAGRDWLWHSLDDFPGVPEAVEDADTLADNAMRKALHYAEATGLPTLADDSGLEVDCLGGAPGVLSARYAGRPHDDAANNQKLVAALEGVPPGQRTARFYCAMVLARPNEVLAETRGAVEGVIIDEPRGANGFGYDPHFLIPSLGKTMAELPAQEKNALSHRGQALRAMLPEIARLLDPQNRAG
jgi:XTP/dITP diphosphohydrolase